ncbi:MAG: hypothetical protein HDR12_17650 [Lachnospiraceae bacterium]|nr:hypothetical protein [Lachnospiraceae bacterium]
MWNTFLESVNIFQNYVGYHQNKFLFGIYLFFLLYLWKTEKNKRFRMLFVYVPTLLLICFFCPLFHDIFAILLKEEETYYRMLWLLQMSMVSAYGALKLCGKYRKLMLVIMCIAIVSCGSFVYQSVNIFKAENLYHIPNEVVKAASFMEPEEGRIRALVPAEMIHFIRQYTDRITLPYGREMLIDRWNFQSDLYEAMELSEVIETPSFVELTRDNYCMYVVLRKDRLISEPLTDYGFELFAQTDNYLIYLDTIWE